MPKHFQIASCEVEEKVTKTLWFPVLTITELESRQTGLRIYGKRSKYDSVLPYNCLEVESDCLKILYLKILF